MKNDDSAIRRCPAPCRITHPHPCDFLAYPTDGEIQRVTETEVPCSQSTSIADIPACCWPLGCFLLRPQHLIVRRARQPPQLMHADNAVPLDSSCYIHPIEFAKHPLLPWHL